jgi:hypothetical protein
VAQFLSRRGKLHARILSHEPGVGLTDAALGLETGDRRPFGDDRMCILERGKLLVGSGGASAKQQKQERRMSHAASNSIDTLAFQKSGGGDAVEIVLVGILDQHREDVALA